MAAAPADKMTGDDEEETVTRGRGVDGEKPKQEVEQVTVKDGE